MKRQRFLGRFDFKMMANNKAMKKAKKNEAAQALL